MADVEDERLKELYDVEKFLDATGGADRDDPYPAFAELRAQGAVHKGSVRQLLGYGDDGIVGAARPDAPRYTAFSFEANDIVLRENLIFSSEFYAGLTTPMFGRCILEMVGDEHRRYRALVQPAFSPKRAQWWIDEWIGTLVEEAVSAIAGRGRAELNADLCARIPLHTITSSFGLSSEEALDFRAGVEDETKLAFGGEVDFEAMIARHERTNAVLRGLIEDRRSNPQDDLITMLAQSELVEGEQRQLLTDEEICGFARLILTAGSGTTWRQLGITLVGLLSDPSLVEAVRDDRELLRRAIDESVRWDATDPVFRRLVTKDVTLCGVDIPAGAIIDMNLGAANRDPARWDDPDRFDPHRPPKPNLGFAGGPHVCLGMHVARAEMFVALDAVLDRLPDLRWDPAAEPPRIVGLEHRGPIAVPVTFGSAA